MPKLTEKQVETLAPKGEDYCVWDTEVMGFGVRVRKTGAKSFVLMYRRGGKQRKHTMGKPAVGYGVKEARERANASYDAFKLFSVFHPGLIVGLTVPLAALWSARQVWFRVAAAALLVVALAGIGRTTVLFAREMANPPLRVERGILELRRLETMPRVTSLNMRIEKFWSRLWANAMLLRKPQYFPVHTYEGRLNTALKGEWDLSDSLLRSFPAREADFVEVNPQFHAVRVAAPGRVELTFGDGWHPEEGSGFNRWRWSSGVAGIRVVNRAERTVKVHLTLRARALERGRLQLELGDIHLGGPRVLNGSIQRLEYEGVILPPGPSTLILENDRPPGRAAANDPRLLAVALYELTVQAEP